MFSAIYCFTISAVVLYMIMSDRVKDGVVVKAGLILIAIGFFGGGCVIYDGHDSLAIRAILFIGTGVLICVGGVFYRGWLANEKRRRFSDWIGT
jgi:hypothetical protein